MVRTTVPQGMTGMKIAMMDDEDKDPIDTDRTEAFHPTRDASDDDTELDEDDFGGTHYVDEDEDQTTPLPDADDLNEDDLTRTEAETTLVMDPIASVGNTSGAEMDQTYIAQEAGDESFSRAGLHRRERTVKRTVIIVCSVLGALLAIYIGLSIFFMFHFLPNTRINSVDCSYKDTAAVSSIVESQVDSYQLTLEERDGRTEDITGSAIGLTYVEDDKIPSLLDGQNPWTWPAAFFQDPNSSTLHATVRFDDDKLKKAIDALGCMDTSKMVAPVDAYAEYDTTKNAYAPHPEVLGTTIDTSVIYDAIESAVTATQDSLDLSDGGCYVAPAITTTTQSLLDKIDLYNRYCCFCITYTFGSTNEVLDANTAINWFSTNADGTMSFDDDAMVAWLSDFGSRHDTVGTTRTFTSMNGNSCTVTGGTYGWSVDEDAEADAIRDAITNHTVETREPIWEQTAAAFSAQDWGTSYIELDLTNQHMYLVQDGKVTFQADVVTGLPTPAKHTPEGVWDILEMKSPNTLVGEIQSNGEPEYRTPVAYWMRMTWSGVGFHDATWQPSFGGDAYTYRGSHGCINMAYSDAATLYSMISVGLPVISHY